MTVTLTVRRMKVSVNCHYQKIPSSHRRTWAKEKTGARMCQITKVKWMSLSKFELRWRAKFAKSKFQNFCLYNFNSSITSLQQIIWLFDNKIQVYTSLLSFSASPGSSSIPPMNATSRPNFSVTKWRHISSLSRGTIAITEVIFSASKTTNQHHLAMCKTRVSHVIFDIGPCQEVSIITIVPMSHHGPKGLHERRIELCQNWVVACLATSNNLIN